MKYVLDHQPMPSRALVTEWIRRLEILEESELVRLGSDLEALGRFLQSGR